MLKRPPGDNGRGIHWSASIYHSIEFDNKNEWARWKRELAALNIKWAKILDDGGGSAEGLAKALWFECGIIPIIRLYRHQPNAVGPRGQITDREVQTIKRIVKALGFAVPFETNNEPDLPDEWKDGNRPPNWWEVVVDNIYEDARKTLDAGGFWLFPAFTHGKTLEVPGTNPYYHNVLETFCQRHNAKSPTGQELLRRSGIAIHNYVKHPLSYPYDDVNQKGAPLTREEYERLGPGPSGPLWGWDGQSMEQINAWRASDKNPGDTVFQDWTGFNAYQVWDKWALNTTGTHLPIFTTEGGSVIGDRVDRRYARVSPKQQVEETVAIAKWMMDEAPEWYVAHCDWLIADAEMGHASGHGTYTTWESQCWYTWYWSETAGWNFKGQIPCVQAVKDMPSYPRKNGGGSVPEPPDPEPPVVIPPEPPTYGTWRVRQPYRIPGSQWQGRHAQVFGQTLRDGKPVTGVHVKCWWDGMTGSQKPFETVSANDKGFLGYYEFTVSAGIFYVQVMEDGAEVSPPLRTDINYETGSTYGHVGWQVDMEQTTALPEPPPGPDPSGFHAILLGQTVEAIQWDAVTALQSYVKRYRPTITFSHDDAMRYPNVSVISTHYMPVSQEVIELVRAKVKWLEVIEVYGPSELWDVMTARADEGRKYG